MLREGKEQEQRERWEVARWQMFMMMQMHPYIKAQNKAKTPQEWVRFAWDEKPRTEAPADVKVTEGQMMELDKIVNSTIGK